MAFLVLEDEFLVALDVEQILTRGLGLEIALAHTAEEAMATVAAGRITGGLLDVVLNGSASFVVADALLARSTPFGFLSAADDRVGWPLRFRSSPCLGKPCGADDLLRFVAGLVGRQEP